MPAPTNCATASESSEKQCGPTAPSAAYHRADRIVQAHCFSEDSEAVAQLRLARACYRGLRIVRCEALARGLLAAGACRADAINLVCQSLADQGRIREALAASHQLLQETNDRADYLSRMILWANFDETLSEDDRLEMNQHFERRHAPATTPEENVFPNSADPDRRLRVGFMACELFDHSKFFFTRPLFEAFDRSRLQVFVYADVAKPDQCTDRVREATDCWRDVRGVNDRAQIRQIRRDEIDILVDVSGHVHRNRLTCLLHKPAPILVEYMESPLGLSVFDYRITDAVADPPTLESRYPAQLARIPGGFHAYEPPADAPAISAPPRAFRQRPVFCCMATAHKYSPTLLDA